MNVSDENSFPFSDLMLARRREKTEALSNVDFVEARGKAFPNSGAQWLEVAGAYAMYDGVTSPSTQTFGLGMFQPVASADMQRIEEFFKERGAPVFHEVCPLADPSLLGLLNERGYEPMEFTSVLYRPILHDLNLTASRNEKIQVRLIQEGERELWRETSAQGW